MAEVKIKITADGAQAAAEINKVKSAAESASAIFASLKARNNQSDQASYLAGLTDEAKATAETGKAAARAALQKKDLKDVVQALGRDFPILSSAIVLLKHPYAIAAAGIGAFIAVVKQQIDIQIQAAQASAKMATAIGPLMEQLSKSSSIATMAADLRAYADSLDAANIASQSSKEKLDAANTAADKENNLLRDKIELQREAARNAIKRDQATGAITGDEAAARLKLLGGQFANEDAAAAIAADKARAERTEAAAADARQRAQQIEKELELASVEAATAAARVKKQEEMAKQAAAVRAERMPELKKELEENMRLQAAATQDTSGDLLQSGVKLMRPGELVLKKQQRELEAELSSLMKSEDTQGAGVINLRSDASSASSYVNTLRGARDKANAEAVTLGQTAAGLRGSAATTAAAEQTLSPARAGNAASEADSIRIAELKKTIERLNKEAADTQTQIYEALKGGFLLRAAADQKFLRALNDEKARLEQLAARGNP